MTRQDLQSRFPWLGTEDGDVSGADTIAELEDWYRELPAKEPRTSTVIGHLEAILERASQNDFTTIAEDRALARAIEKLREVSRGEI